MPSSLLSTGALDGGFAFDLWDGENLSPGHFFLVRAQREPLISLAKKQSLTVCPGGYGSPSSQFDGKRGPWTLPPRPA